MSGPRFEWRCRDRVLPIGDRPLVMGVLNVTTDSFSDGGCYADAGAAVAHGERLWRDGADILDVGGESTRPGAAPVDADEELRRVIPVVEALAARTDAVLSVDTTKAVVARRAVEAGARIVNDVSAMTHDAEMPRVLLETGAGAVLMHMRGEPRTMQEDPRYDDVVAEVHAWLRDRADALAAAGAPRDALAVDPGIGFGKTLEHNLLLLGRLDAVRVPGLPLVVGLSRKSFLGKLTGRPVGERLAASLAAATFCMLNGADVVRVHDVRETVDAARVAAALAGAARRGAPG